MRREQMLPSPLSRDAADGLAELVDDATAGRSGGERWQPPGLWEALAQGDWTTLADGSVPGSSEGMSLLDLCTVAEAWGRSLVGLPLLTTLVARRWLAERPAPDVAIGFGVPEFDAHLITYPDQISAILHGDKTDVVPPLDGVVSTWAPSLPLGITTAAPAAARQTALEYAVVALAETVGVSDRALRAAIEYARIRKQFGQPIGAFQAVKHRLADMHCAVELARSGVTWYCAEPESMQGTVGTVLQMCSTVVEGAIQVHGGIGYTWECGLHFALRHVAQSHRLVTALVESLALPAPELVRVG